MHRVVAVQDAGFIIKAGVDLRVLGDRVDDRADQERQQGQMTAVLMPGIELGAQLFESADIDFLDVGEMRDVPLRLLQMLGDRAAQTGDRHLFDAVAARERHRTGGGVPAGRRIGLQILLRDPPGRTGAAHKLQFDAEIPSPPPHRRRRQWLLPELP